jgi:hypothetical protein
MIETPPGLEFFAIQPRAVDFEDETGVVVPGRAS